MSLSRLRILDISSNKLSGALPSSFGKLRALRCLNLSENSLTGIFPREFSRCINLEELYLKGNSIDYKANSMSTIHYLLKYIMHARC